MNRIQKMILVGVMAGTATLAMAEAQWQKISFNNKDVTLYMDVNGIKPKVDEYKNRYLETTINRTYAAPKKLKSGKYYDQLNQTFAVDCMHGAYAATNPRWFVNRELVHKEITKNEDWNKYDSDDSGSYATTARAICKHYKSFLGG